MSKLERIILTLIILAGFWVRVFGMKWDGGMHFHPDERMLIMVADRINFFHNLNPDFFNYGSLPVYILKGTSQLIDSLLGSHMANYDGMLVIGRLLSAIIDTWTILLVFLLTIRISGKCRVALTSSFIYATMFFPIQNSHFFVVDVYLTFWTLSAVYALIRWLNTQRSIYVVFMAITCAAALTTKFSGVIFAGLIGVIFTFMSIRSSITGKNSYVRTLIHLLIFYVGCVAAMVFFMPYAFAFVAQQGLPPSDLVNILKPLYSIFNGKFLNDIIAQTTMNSNPYIFPYTLQYVGTTAYVYYVKNMLIWGAGPVASLLCLTGIWNGLRYGFHAYTGKKTSSQIIQLSIMFICLIYGIYFIVLGKSAVKFMRYMLPLYPIIALGAGYGLDQIYLHVKKLLPAHRFTASIAIIIIVLAQLVWLSGFLSIYTHTSTRIEATQWILNNIPKGSVIAVEHWDDRVPIYTDEYVFEELALYDQPDDSSKWMFIDEKLNRAQYLVIASNRLYIPLQRLNDCTIYKTCYPLTAHYYQQLFDGSRNYTQIAEFTSYPQWRIGNFVVTLPDDTADESFTVYDHPKIMVFKNTRRP